MSKAWYTYSQLLGPFAIALVALALIVHAAGQLREAAYPGVEWSRANGAITLLDPHGPAAELIAPDDRVVAVDGVSLDQSLFLSGKPVGALLALELERDGARRIVSIRLAPMPIGQLYPWFMVLFLVALPFWLLGLALLTFMPPGGQRWLGFLFCELASLTFSTVYLAWLAPMTALTPLYRIFNWWSYFFSLLFHVYLLAQPSRGHVRLLVALGGVPVLGGLLEVLEHPLGIVTAKELMHMLRMSWQIACTVGIILVLARAYRRRPPALMRRRLGLLIVGAGIAFAPILLLGLLPHSLFREPLLPYQFTLLFFVFIPLAYGYMIFKYQLLHLDRYVNRGAALMLTLIGLASVYGITYMVARQQLPERLWQSPLLIFVLAALASSLIAPLYRRLRIVIEHLLYGGWYDYRSVVQHVSERVERATDGGLLAQELCEGIYTTMQVEWVALLLPSSTGDLRAMGAAGTGGLPDLDAVVLPTNGRLVDYFQRRRDPIEASALRLELHEATLEARERELAVGAHTQLWLPLSAGDQLVGLFLFGQKRGGHGFDQADQEILRVVAHQAGIAIQKTMLLGELQERTEQGKRLHQQLLRAREDERARLARDLHDDVIQELIGLTYQLSRLQRGLEHDRERALGLLQDEVRRVIDDVRHLCADLRPPSLDSMGLQAAIQARMRVLKQTSELELRLQLEGDQQRALPESVSLCLFRVVQEGLANVERHAQATCVDINLRFGEDELCLTISDNGQGFAIAASLDELIDQQHFGLVGLRERLELIQGSLEILSAPGMGTSLRARVPLPSAAAPDPADYAGTIKEAEHVGGS